MEDTPVFGIDLGTTNSCIALWKNGGVEILRNKFEENTPSCVSFIQDGVVVGNSALIPHSIFEAKRVIGRCYEEIQKDLKYYHNISKDSRGRPKYTVKVKGQDEPFYAEQISAIVLKKLKQDGESQINHEVIKCLI